MPIVDFCNSSSGDGSIPVTVFFALFREEARVL